MNLMKKFNSSDAARRQMYALNRAGFEAMARGVRCYIKNLSICADALVAFDDWSEV